MDIPVHAIKSGRLHIINNKAKVEKEKKIYEFSYKIYENKRRQKFLYHKHKNSNTG